MCLLSMVRETVRRYAIFATRAMALRDSISIGSARRDRKGHVRTLYIVVDLESSSASSSKAPVVPKDSPFSASLPMPLLQHASISQRSTTSTMTIQPPSQCRQAHSHPVHSPSTSQKLRRLLLLRAHQRPRGKVHGKLHSKHED